MLLKKSEVPDKVEDLVDKVELVVKIIKEVAD